MRPQMMKDYCSIYSVSPPEVQSHRTIRSSICLASATLSAIVAVSRGDDLLMSSLANRTAAMMEAAITSVDANRSCLRRCSSSLAIALFISPISVSTSQSERASD
jgi:hypothetical protein